MLVLQPGLFRAGGPGRGAVGLRLQAARAGAEAVRRSSRARPPGEWLIEFVIYGFGGAVLGFLLGLLMLRAVRGTSGVLMVAGLTVAGFLLGGFGGEPAVNWVGRMIREREER